MSAASETSVLHIRVTPRASDSRIERWEGGVLHLRVSAPPAEGAANKAALELVGQALRIPKSRLRLKSGGASRVKTLEVLGLSQHETGRRAAALFE